jgi:hypothetical protein
MVTMEHKQSKPTVQLNLNNFKIIEAMELKTCIEVPLNCITFVPNFIKIYQAVQKLLVGDRQRDLWFDKPTFTFGR